MDKELTDHILEAKLHNSITITIEAPRVVTILWHGNNTHIRIVGSAANLEEFVQGIADALKRAFLEDHAESQETEAH